MKDAANWFAGRSYWEGLSGPSKVLVAVGWTALAVFGPFVFISASNIFFGRDLPLTLWMPMSVMAVIIIAAGLAARRAGLAARRGADRNDKA